MQVKHLQTVVESSNSLNRVGAIAFSPNNARFAVANADRLVLLFNEAWEMKDRFATRSADSKGTKNYRISGMAFSPDSTKLAIAQTDNCVFVYKLGLAWGEKKKICNRIHSASPITSIIWLSSRQNDFVVGTADGKVCAGQLRSNKFTTLYNTGSMVVSLAANPQGNGFVSGHQDGTVCRFLFEGERGPTKSRLARFTSAPTALAWGQSICIAGNDRRIIMYNPNGGIVNKFDFTHDQNEKDYTHAVSSPSGHAIVIASFNKLRVLLYRAGMGKWEEVAVKEVNNLYSVTALTWKPDGSKLLLSNVTGAVEAFDVFLRRVRYSQKFELTYISPSSVIVKRLATGARTILTSAQGFEIVNVDVYHDQYMVARTQETLILADLESVALSEIPWMGSGNERFFFECPGLVMVFHAGELSLVEFGKNEFLGSCRTEHVSSHLLSVRMKELKTKARHGKEGQCVVIKRIAYLVDVNTVRVLDLGTGLTAASIVHDAKIDWLELNEAGTKLLYRDKRQQLHLVDVASTHRSTLLHYCTYVQWVPLSDVVVAQSRGKLCVWYNIDTPDRVTQHDIKGDIAQIVRSDQRTDVLVMEGANEVGYSLDHSLIEFGAAIETCDYARAIATLEGLQLTPETEAMWRSLGNIAIQEKELVIAERCYAALGDVPKAQFLRQLNKMVEYVESLDPTCDGTTHFIVQAKLAMLNKQFRSAEQLLLEQGQVDETIEMYQTLHKWEESIEVAEAKAHPEVPALRHNYLSWLMATGQEDRAAEMKVKDGDYLAACELYLNGGFPGKAATLIVQQGLEIHTALLERVSAALAAAGKFAKAGEFYERLGQHERAFEAYRKGHAYKQAVDLCRRIYPQNVLTLEEEWGDYLVSQRQSESAINHFIEARQYAKAIETAIQAKQWAKAAQYVEAVFGPSGGGVDMDALSDFSVRIAQHYEGVGDYATAQKLLIRSGNPQLAVEMCGRAGDWDGARVIAEKYMPGADLADLYVTQAQRLEAQMKFADAEKLYIACKEPDLAISMYKKQKLYDDMMRLVGIYYKERVAETHLHLGQELETEDELKEAEKHYVASRDWKSAVNMYRANDLWEDALRVAKHHGGDLATRQVAYAYSLAGADGGILLTKLGLVEAAIDYACEKINFAHAFKLAQSLAKNKLPDVHLKNAMYMEDEGHFKDAEAEFVKAGRPREAIDMYIHQQDWAAALAVAETHEPAAMEDVYTAQAKAFIKKRDFAKAEDLLIKARRLEIIINAYKEADMWEEAIRLTKQHMPYRLKDIHREYEEESLRRPEVNANVLDQAKMWERQGEWAKAIDVCLSISPDESPDADPNEMEEVWLAAVRIATTHIHERVGEVAATVAERLIAIDRPEQGAAVYLSIESFYEAIEVYITAGLWDHARRVAHEKAPDLVKRVESAYQQNLMNLGQADTLLAAGNVDAALSLYARRGEWETCLEVASKQKGPDVAAEYAVKYADSLSQSGHFTQAAEVLAQFGGLPSSHWTRVYANVVLGVLALPYTGEETGEEEHAVVNLKAFMDTLITAGGLTGTKISPQDTELFQRYKLILHLMEMRFRLRANKLHEMGAMAAISLVRYVGEIPADKAFWLAGTACREANWLSDAFVYLNKYLDISEAMEEGETAEFLDNADFEGTGIPYDYVLPAAQFLEEAEREHTRNWVLSISMDQSVDQSLSTRTCSSCGADIYHAALTCRQCSARSQPCVVTGFPVLPDRKVTCAHCRQPANKDTWNKWLVKERSCPWCLTSQSVNF